MKKAKIRECPFCGRIPSGERFCSTDKGPALMCDHCGVMGPSALDKEFIGADEDKFNPQAIAKWNQRTFDRDSYRMGIEAAASFVEMFDKHVQHSHRLSDCILAKFNLISKRQIQRQWNGARAGIKKPCKFNGKVGFTCRTPKYAYPINGLCVRHRSLANRAIARGEFSSHSEIPDSFFSDKSTRARIGRKRKSISPDRRMPTRRKGERRVAGGPEFVMGSMASRERRQNTRRDGARRRKP